MLEAISQIRESRRAKVVGFPSSSREGHSDGPGLVVWGLLLIAMFGPLAFGAVEPWAIIVLQTGAVLLFALWLWQQLRRGVLEIRWNPILWPLIFFGTVVLCQLVFRTSVYAYATKSGLLLFIADAILAFVAAQCLSSTRLKRLGIAVLAWFGSMLAIFGVIQELTSNGKMYWLVPPQHMPSPIYGPYVNHNHYAGLMELLAPLAFVFALDPSLPRGKRLLAFFGGILMASSIVLSLSRGGTIAFALEMIFLTAVWARFRRRGGALWLGGAIVLLMIGFIALSATSSVWSRLETFRAMGSEPDVTLRVAITQDTVRMFRARPLAGWGFGTFTTVYPAYQSFYWVKFVNAAHNDYAQLLAETGLPGLAALLWFVFVLYRDGVRNLRSRGSDIRVCALAACTGLAIHSFFDFNLQIPANAAMFSIMAVLATGSEDDQTT